MGQPMRPIFLAFCLAIMAGSALAQGIGVPPLGGVQRGDIESLFANLTATAGGTQATSQILRGSLNEFATVATAADGALLPPCIKAPAMVTVMNEAASNAMQVFASGSETIDGTAGATGVSLAAGARATYICVVPSFGAAAGKWFSH